MKPQILAAVGAIISLFVSACGKSETVIPKDTLPQQSEPEVSPTQQAPQPSVQSGEAAKPSESNTNQNNPTDNDDITVEDYTNSITEFNEYDISYVECTKYGPIKEIKDACGNMMPDGDCNYYIKKRCPVANNNQCECINDSEIFDCANSGYNRIPLPEVHKRKYATSTPETMIKVNYCDTEDHKTKIKEFKALIRKLCVIDDNNHVTKSCQCNIFKDGCGNYIDKTGRPVYGKDYLLKKDGRGLNFDKLKEDECLSQYFSLGDLVDCNDPQIHVYLLDPAEDNLDLNLVK